nr:glutathione S-transferase U17-like [Ipomoea trifida]
MASESVKLLGSWASPVVLRARIAFNIKSVAYEFLEENFAAKSDLLLKSNPVYKKVPVIIHNQNPVCESLIILQYIDEVWTSGPAIMPAHPYDRAVHRFWATYIDDTFYGLIVTVRIKFLDEAKVPGLANWAEDFCADDAVKDVMPSTEKLAEFAMKIFTHMKPQS